MRSKVTDASELEIAAEILRYLERNPYAADSLAGITTWWLSSVHSIDSSEKIKLILDDLVAKRQLVARKMSDGEILYSGHGRTKS